MCTKKFGHYDGKKLKTVLRETVFGPPKIIRKQRYEFKRKYILQKRFRLICGYLQIDFKISS